MPWALRARFHFINDHPFRTEVRLSRGCGQYITAWGVMQEKLQNNGALAHDAEI